MFNAECVYIAACVNWVVCSAVSLQIYYNISTTKKMLMKAIGVASRVMNTHIYKRIVVKG